MSTEATYKVTKLFIGGTLSGLTYTEQWTKAPQVGTEYQNPIGGSPYRIVAVEPMK
jgi:hypothetical protein